MKKSLILILIILIIISLCLIGYLIYNQNKSNLTAVNKKTNITGTQTSLFPVGSTTILLNKEVPISLDINAKSNQTKKSSLGVPGKPDVSQMIISNLSVVTINKKKETIFTEKTSGNIYLLDEQNNLKRLSNFTLPGINESYFGNKFDILYTIFKQEKNNKLSTYIGGLELNKNKNPLELKTTHWINTPSIAISPNGENIAYLEKQNGGGTNLYISDWGLMKPKKIWSSPFIEWRLSWPKDNIINITSRASFDYPGISYNLDINNNQEKISLVNINGLTTKNSPDNKKIIYSKSLLGAFNFYKYDQASSTSYQLEPTTLPEKCVWIDSDSLYCAVPKKIPSGQYPDDWYKGKISFADDIWKIDLKNKTTILTNQLKGNYDLINLTINENTGWLYAINKNDNTLQAFSLKP